MLMTLASMAPISFWWNKLPIDVVLYVIQFTSCRVSDLQILSAVSTELLVATKLYANNEWAEVWESEFCHREPALHESLKNRVVHVSWRMRLSQLFRMNTNAAEESIPPEHTFYSMIRFQTMKAKVLDFIMSNEPYEGNPVVDLGTWTSCVWLYYSTRDSRAEMNAQQHEEIVFAPFNLPTNASEVRENYGTLSQGNSLLLYSINGKSVSEHRNLDELLETVKCSGEFARWRVILYPRSQEVMLQVVPPQCQFAIEAHAAMEVDNFEVSDY